MNLVFISIIVTTVAQRVLLGFSWLMIFSYLGRIIFLTRVIGAVVSYKVSCAFEAIHMGFVLLNIIMNGIPQDWPGVVIDLLLCCFVVVLMFIDNALYLYVVVDDEDGDDTEKE